MSVRINASGESLTRTSGLPSTTNFTICGWAKMTVRSGQYQYFAGLENAASSASAWLLLGYNNSGSFDLSATTANALFSSAPSAESWFFFAIAQSTAGVNSLKGYWAAPGDTSFKTAQCDGSSFTPALMAFGNDSWDEYCNIALANIKVYDAVLTEAELWNEMRLGRPARMANLHLWLPLFSTGDTKDYSGNAKDPTANGSLTSEEQPPVAWSVSPILVPYVATGGGGSTAVPVFLHHLRQQGIA